MSRKLYVVIHIYVYIIRQVGWHNVVDQNKTLIIDILVISRSHDEVGMLRRSLYKFVVQSSDDEQERTNERGLKER